MRHTQFTSEDEVRAVMTEASFEEVSKRESKRAKENATDAWDTVQTRAETAGVFMQVASSKYKLRVQNKQDGGDGKLSTATRIDQQLREERKLKVIKYTGRSKGSFKLVQPPPTNGVGERRNREEDEEAGPNKKTDQRTNRQKHRGATTRRWGPGAAERSRKAQRRRR
jgi:hypothetical protein